MSSPLFHRMDDRTKLLILFGILFVFYLILFYLAPYTRDDWAWGSSIGIDRLLDKFDNYNGRYGGNITEILLTNFRWLKALVSALVTSAIIFLMIPLKGNRIFSMLLATALILIEPVSMFSQTLVYVAAFSNYVIPTVFMLIFFKYFNSYIENGIREIKNQKQNRKTVAVITILGFISCIFIEHITLYLLFWGFFLNVILFYKYKMFFTDTTGFFVGTIGGAVLMFSNGAYWNVMSGIDKYRSLGAAESGNIYMDQIGNVLFFENWFFNAVICATSIFIIYKNRNVINRIIITSGYLISTLFISLIILIAVINKTDISIDSKIYGFLFEGTSAAVIYSICILGCTIILVICTSDIIIRRKIIFLAISIIIVNAPLIMVNPVSPRCFFPAYILFIMIILQSLSQFKIKWRWNLPVTAIVVFGMVFLITIYMPIFEADNKRLDRIRENIAKGHNVVTISELPNDKYVWQGTPKSGTKWEYRYKKFYNIPEHVTLQNEN